MLEKEIGKISISNIRTKISKEGNQLNSPKSGDRLSTYDRSN